MTRTHARLALTGGIAGILAIAFVSCSDAPTAPESFGDAAPMINKNRQPTPIVLEVSGPLSDGGTFTGTATIRRLDLATDRTLVAAGVISGTAVTAAGLTQTITNQEFTAPIEITREHDVAAATPAGRGDAFVRPAAMTRADAVAVQTVALQVPAIACDVLNLDLGPLFLNLLGLTVDLAPVVLDVRAVPGAGNLLGNLLCALVSLLDGPGALAAILQLLGNITGLLGGLTAPAA